MAKVAKSPELLIPWITKNCDEETFEGMKWADKEKRIFFVSWLHKSTDQWTAKEAEVFEAWASHKRKTGGKNARDMKAAFRCATRSKKDNIVQVAKTKKRIYWQIVEPKTTAQETSKPTPQTKPKERKRKNKNLVSPVPTPETSSDAQLCHETTTTSMISEVQRRVSPLPPFNSLHASPLTPPHQSSDVFRETSDYGRNYILPESMRLTPPVGTPLMNSEPNDVYWMNFMTDQSLQSTFKSNSFEPSYISTGEQLVPIMNAPSAVPSVYQPNLDEDMNDMYMFTEPTNNCKEQVTENFTESAFSNELNILLTSLSWEMGL